MSWRTVWHHNIHFILFDILTILTYIFASWRTFFYFIRTFRRDDVLFDVMYFLRYTYFLTSWRTFDFMTYFLTSWCTFVIMITFHTFWRHDVHFDLMAYVVTSWLCLFRQIIIIIIILTYFTYCTRSLWRHDVIITYFPYCLMLWRTCWCHIWNAISPNLNGWFVLKLWKGTSYSCYIGDTIPFKRMQITTQKYLA